MTLPLKDIFNLSRKQKIVADCSNTWVTLFGVMILVSSLVFCVERSSVALSMVANRSLHTIYAFSIEGNIMCQSETKCIDLLLATIKFTGILVHCEFSLCNPVTIRCT